MGYNMGIGKLADRNVTFKRKFRWIFRVEGINGNPSAVIPEHYVKATKRPSVEFGTVTLSHLHGDMPMPGRLKFGDTDVTYFDIIDNEDSMLNLYNWIGGVYDFLSPTGTSLNPRAGSFATGPGGYSATAKLGMLDGCGNGLEQWTMYMCFPTKADFGDLGYESADSCEISVSMAYQFAKRVNLAGNQPSFTCASNPRATAGAGFNFPFVGAPGGPT